MNILLKKFRSACLIFGIIATIIFPKVSYAYPVFAQNAYENPREATGRIVCANCHLASKPTEVEVPQAVLPDTVFEAVVSVPYDTSVKQIGANGKRAALNVGAVVVLPEGFKLAPKDRLSDEIKAKTKGVLFSHIVRISQISLLLDQLLVQKTKKLYSQFFHQILHKIRVLIS